MSLKRPRDPEDDGADYNGSSRSSRSFADPRGEFLPWSTTFTSQTNQSMPYHGSIMQPAYSRHTLYVEPPYSCNSFHRPSSFDSELVPETHFDTDPQSYPPSSFLPGLPAGTDASPMTGGSFGFDPWFDSHRQPAANPAPVSHEATSSAASGVEPITSNQPRQCAVDIGKRPKGQPVAIRPEMKSPELGTIRVKLSLSSFPKRSLPKAGLLKAEALKAAQLGKRLSKVLSDVGTLPEQIQAFIELFDEDYFPLFIDGEVMSTMTYELGRLVRSCGGKELSKLDDSQSYLQKEIAAITAAFRHKQEEKINHYYTYQNFKLL